MPLADYQITGPPDLTLDQFGRILRDAGSPATPEAAHIYAALKATGVRCAVWLAFGWVESKLGREGVIANYETRNMGNVRSPESAALGTTIDTPRGKFAKYATWADGAYDWGKRLTGPKYGQAGLKTIKQVLPKYAPSADSNDPDAYARTVLAKVEEWAGETKMGHVPKPPITNHIVTVPPRKDGVGLDVIGNSRAPGATVLHSMAGTFAGCDGYFQQPGCPALTDFGVGQTNYQGSGFAQIIQWCDFRGRIEPWASGPVRVPEGDGPRWLAHIGGAGAVNEVGVSIEHDDTTRADGTVGPIAAAEATVYQWSASVWLQAWLHAEVFGQTAATYDWNVHHREICGHAYKDCPRPRIYDHTDEYQAAVKAIMAHHQDGTPYPAGGLVINGMKINTPPEGTPPPAPQPTPGNQIIPFVHADGRPGVTILFDGQATQPPGVNVADLGVSVPSVTTGQMLDQSVQSNVFGGWKVRK